MQRKYDKTFIVDGTCIERQLNGSTGVAAVRFNQTLCHCDGPFTGGRATHYVHVHVAAFSVEIAWLLDNIT